MGSGVDNPARKPGSSIVLESAKMRVFFFFFFFLFVTPQHRSLLTPSEPERRNGGQTPGAQVWNYTKMSRWKLEKPGAARTGKGQIIVQGSLSERLALAEFELEATHEQDSRAYKRVQNYEGVRTRWGESGGPNSKGLYAEMCRFGFMEGRRVF